MWAPGGWLEVGSVRILTSLSLWNPQQAPCLSSRHRQRGPVEETAGRAGKPGIRVLGRENSTPQGLGLPEMVNLPVTGHLRPGMSAAQGNILSTCFRQPRNAGDLCPPLRPRGLPSHNTCHFGAAGAAAMAQSQHRGTAGRGRP